MLDQIQGNISICIISNHDLLYLGHDQKGSMIGLIRYMRFVLATFLLVNLLHGPAESQVPPAEPPDTETEKPQTEPADSQLPPSVVGSVKPRPQEFRMGFLAPWNGTFDDFR